MLKIGIISDTHGSLPSKVFDVFSGVDLIIHAGDIGSDDIITELSSICRVITVHGNMDTPELALKYPKQIVFEEHGYKFHLSHKDSYNAGAVDIVIQGHTHTPLIKRETGKLHINPGKASSSVALLDVDNNLLDARIIFI